MTTAARTFHTEAFPISDADINGYGHLHGGVQMAWVEAAARQAAEAAVGPDLWQPFAIERMDFSAPGRDGDRVRGEVAPVQPAESDTLTVQVILFAEGPQRPEPVQLATAWVRFQKGPPEDAPSEPKGDSR